MSKGRDRMSQSVWDPSGAGLSFSNDLPKARKNTDKSSMIKSNANYTDIDLGTPYFLSINLQISKISTRKRNI